ncbi:oligoendopeptidase [Alkalihalobacillus alcalophilus ATCC 27647 = CGMCC 1.3604]|uniref:Oligoendopeptidase n=1 Tax=Alkalihalobacillus alcalophilus ATCC 27647 = CGMCC 1.3604 TaxID=1218173 RepID=A0A094WIX8_ALKAL|nr:M3 family oligoendopeptidase [Alkalihalobacillus alcalophilus]KGA96766.1 oligoendopeptidase [Alkalihalobacillus alcalophilus ATCC 27647 = CGMCC 1.3604]MED1561795.1 M3 family oligoendopeptidase [Alkalihalobacillus alcalophilus]THG91810.1 oligoendopeptidase [Alkalihalobacillus alcalophilus ATCC 27647 = CGMCC 1.3604]
MKYPITWDLESVFAGGSESKEYVAFVEETDVYIKKFNERLAKVDDSVEQLAELIEDIQQLMLRARQSGAFISCLSSANVQDKKAIQWLGTIRTQSNKIQQIWTKIEEKIVAFSEEKWQELLKHEKLQPIVFSLNESREKAKDKLPPDQERLASKLAIDGYHSWGSFYNQLVGDMEFPFEEDGEEKRLSAGQIQNRMNHSDRDVRKRAFFASEKGWEQKADTFATTLNSLAGFRLQLYDARGWENVLKEPLDINRMQEQTLDTMWNTIEENKPMLHQFMERKARLLNIDQLAFYDVFAPLPVDGDEKISYDDACDLIIKHFKTISPKLANFAEMALRDGWIEAEDRPGKRPGGFCTSLPLSGTEGESRIFMTYDGSLANVATLAHELGHAYHSHCLKELKPFARSYAMNVAETASTFAENIVADALVKEAQSEDLRLSLLENKISRSLAFFMNIHARFIFEKNFYEARKSGTLSAADLNQLMEEAQKQAFGNALSEYSPTFWASKLHFHITGVPFYNFPYTFGFLFSLGIYKRALDAGLSFEDNYIDLLKDTASMKVEELADKHLGVDLTQAEFWQDALNVVKEDIEEFLKLTEEKIAAK